MPSVNDKVLTTDVNNSYSTGVDIMGTGSVSRGYGQTTFGNSVNTSTLIGPNDYNNIRYDLLNASAHQNGAAAALALAGKVSGQLITPDDANTFESYRSTVDSNRFTAHSSRMSLITLWTQNRTSSWVSSVSANLYLNFSTGTVARYFWNSGGRIEISTSRTGGAASSQNSSWSNLLSSVGTQSFGGNAVYSWGTSPTRLYTATASSPYSSNTFTIDAITNVSNSSGSADIFRFALTWSDPYVDPSPGNPPAPEDIVDGTLSYTMALRYPTGGAALSSPSGSYTWKGFWQIGYPGSEPADYYLAPTFAAYPISGG